MLKAFLKRSLQYFSFALLITFVLSGCTNQNTTQDNKNNIGIEDTNNSQISNTNTALNKLISDIQEDISKNWPYLNKIWPGVDFSNICSVIFFLDSDGKPTDAWILEASGMKELTSEEYANIEYPSVGGFDKIEFNGKKAMSLSIDEEDLNGVNDYYEFITHELIHFYFQDNIIGSENSSRNQEYPIKYEARLYRNMIYNRLGEAILADSDELTQEYIQKAAYWFNKWKTEFPNEVEQIRYTDIYEGHATYIGILSKLAHKESVTKEDIEKEINLEGVLTALGGDSYSIGFFSLHLLDIINPNYKENFFESGKSPIEFLLDDVTPIDDIEDVKVASKLKVELDKLNESMEKSMQNIISSLNDKNIPYLKIDSSYRGSVGLSGFFSYEGINIYADFSSDYKQDDSNILIVKGISIINDSNFNIIPLTSDLNFEVKDDIITFTGDKINGNMRVNSSDEDGRTVYTSK